MFHVKHQSWFNEGMQSLVIRPLVEQDLARHAAIMGDEAVVRYLYEETLSLNDAEAHLARRLAAGSAEPGEWRNFAVDLGGRLIGEVGFVLNSVTHREAEIGYFIDPAFGGKGFATSAVATVVDWCTCQMHPKLRYQHMQLLALELHDHAIDPELLEALHAKSFLLVEHPYL